MDDLRMRLFDDIPFHTFLPWFLLKLASLLLLGSLCLGLAVQVHFVWALGVLGSVYLAVRSAARFPAQAVLLRSTDVVFRDGVLWISEHRIPLEQVALHIDQSLLGRILDYGTVRQRLGSGIVMIHDVANIRALRLLLADRQRYFARTGVTHYVANSRERTRFLAPVHPHLEGLHVLESDLPRDARFEITYSPH